MQTRIKGVLPSIIHHNQYWLCKRTLYVSIWSYIGETARSIFDIVDLTDKENIPGLLIFIDSEKAFDSLEWNFLHNCLDIFNFGPNLSAGLKPFLHKY